MSEKEFYFPCIQCGALAGIIPRMKKSPPEQPSVVDTQVQPNKVQYWTVDPDVAGQRIDNYLFTRLKGAPKSLIYRVLRKGEVRVNRGRIKPEYKLQAGDVLRIPPVRIAKSGEVIEPSRSLVNHLNQAILYEDEHLIVVNKPSGLAVHGGSGVQLGLIESLRQMRPGDSFLELVHRLDKATSGCVMIAKTRRCLRYMQQLLRDGGVTKTYNALVAGRWPKRRQHVSVALLKQEVVNGERIVKAVEMDTLGAKASRTEYRVLAHYQGCSLVEAKPITGRTHQIRVHSQYAGHSILGDDKYASADDMVFARNIGLNRLFLHALQLEFKHIDQRPLMIKAPLADELVATLKDLHQEY